MTFLDIFLLGIPAVLLTGISKGGFGGALGGIAVPLLALTMPPTQAAAIRAAVAEGRFEDITLEVVARGYRQDQVDALIEYLRQFGAGASTIGLVEFVEE